VNEFLVDSDAVLRLLAAGVAGVIVGTEREATDQAAGLRTHVAVSLGAAVFGVVSTLGFAEYEATRADTNIQVDVTRVASQVVVGIGFLGAGIIFRQGTNVRNLTTAASLWVVAAIGLAAGVGQIGLAGLATIVLVITLVLLRPLRSRLHRMRRPKPPLRVEIVLHPGRSVDDVLRRASSVSEIHEVTPGDEVSTVVIEVAGDEASGDTLRHLAAHHDIAHLRVL
jgi:putative Mg2+ transporter-C (MgtC) family protein